MGRINLRTLVFPPLLPLEKHCEFKYDGNLLAIARPNLPYLDKPRGVSDL